MTQASGDSGAGGIEQSQHSIVLKADGETLTIANADFITGADIARDGQDLVLTAPDGSVVVVEGYFNADPAPMIVGPNGAALTPQLINSFIHHAGPVQVAQNGTMDDSSPVGVAKEVSGNATVIRTDGTKVTLTNGMPIYQGDVVETESDGAVNIVFVDESSFAISNNARLAIDEYVFDPDSQGGESNFSVLRGMFVYTSGMIGREDPDDVQIDTPTGSIGIRGTVIAGDVDKGEYTVVEGAIVLRSLNGDEVTLDSQFQTAKFESGTVTATGTTDSQTLSDSFSSLSNVNPGFFSTLQDAGTNDSDATGTAPDAQEGSEQPATGSEPEASPAPGDETFNTFEDSFSTGDVFSDENVFSDDGAFSDNSLTDFSELSATETVDSGLTATIDESGTPGDGTDESANISDPATQAPIAPVITEINDFSPVIGNGGAVFFLGEDSVSGTAAGSVSASDADGNSLSYSITAGNTGSMFSINSLGQIEVSGALDFETLNTYNLTVEVSDGTFTTNAAYTINISDANDLPVLTATGPSLTSITEDSAAAGGDTITSLVSGSISDADSGAINSIAVTGADNTNGTWEYSIDSGTTWNSVPAVSSSSALLLDAASRMRFVPNADYAGTASFTYKGWDLSSGTAGDTGVDTTTDTAFSTASDTADITVSAVNDAPVITADTYNIDENSAAGSAVATVSTASDVDGDTLTFTETGGTGAGLFAISSSGAITVQTGAALDYEAATSYTYEVTVSDGNGGTDFVTMTININDVINETISGSTGSDTLTGSSGDDTLSGLAGDDNLTGGAGNDTLLGGLGDDTFVASNGDGSDTVDGGGQTSVDIYDGAPVTANQTINLGAGGNGSVTDGTDTDTLLNIENVRTGAGSDIFYVTDAAYAYTLDAGTGIDDLYFSSLAASNFITANLSTGTITINSGATVTATGFENLYGTAGNDAITGNSAANDLYGLAGNDTFVSSNGADNYDGGSGTDTIDFSGVAGVVNINLFGNIINNAGFGNSGTTTGIENVIGSSNADTIAGNNDANNLAGGVGADTLHGLDGNDTLNGGDGGDTISGGAGNDVIDGGNGIDVVTYASAAAFVHIDLGGGIFNDGDGGTDALSNVENIIGSGFNDILRGDGGANVLQGDTGDDTLKGSGGTDTLDGGTGTDTADYSIYGFANALSVTLNSTGSTTITSAAGNDTLTSIENITGTEGADTISGSTDTAANIIAGHIGNDTLSGGDGDTISGGAGNDTLTYTGGSAEFELHGGAGADNFIISNLLSIANDGLAMNITGGDGPGQTDILTFAGSGAITLDPDGTEDTIEGVEIFDFSSNGLADSISMVFTNSMVDLNEGNLLVIQINDSDDLNLNLSGLGYQVIGGDIDLTGGANFVELRQIAGSNVIRIEYTVSAGATGSISIANLGGAGPLHLNGILAGVNTTDGFAIIDNIAEGFGYSVSSLGDFDQDGYDDVILTKNIGPLDNGMAFTYFGQPSSGGNMTAGSLFIDSGMFNDPVSDSDVSNLSVSGAGDFNGDGFIDFIAGAPTANDVAAGQTATGNIQIIDGLSGTVLMDLTGMVSPDFTGKSIAGIGDVNADGFADVLVGAPYSGGSYAGSAYLLFGAYNQAPSLDVNTMFDPRYLGDLGPAAFNADAKGIETFSGGIVGPVAFVMKANNEINIVNLLDPNTAFIHGSVLNSTSINSLTGYTAAGGYTDAMSGLVDMAVQGNYLYILAGAVNGATYGQITVLDISDPTSPLFVDFLRDASLLNAKSMDVDLASGQLVVTTSVASNGAIYHFDVNTDGTIGTTAIGDYALNGSLGPVSDLSVPGEVILNGQFAYIVTASDPDGGGATLPGTLQVVNFSIPTTPVMGTQISIPDIRNIFLDKATGTLYVLSSTGGTGEVRVYDVSTPGAPVLINTTGMHALLGNATDITVTGGAAFVTTSGGVIGVDVSDPGVSVTVTGALPNPGSTMNDALALAVDSDGYLHVVSGGTTDTFTSLDVRPDGIRITGLATTDMLGMNVAAAGDFNNDGIADFMISAPDQSGTGKAYLVMGRPELREIDLSTSPDVLAINGIVVDASVPLESQVPLFYAGDLNGVGGSDIAVVHTGGAGRIDFFWGAGTAGGGDNIADFSVISGAGHKIASAGAAGDFNGDGFDDAIVILQETSLPQNIHIYVLFGSDTLTGTVDKAFLDNAANAFHMTYTIPVGADLANFDFVASGAGDLNGDGYYDIAIGLPNLDTTPGVNTDLAGGTDDDSDGSVLIVNGRDTGTGNILQGANPTATALDQVLVGDDTANTLNDGGYADISFRGGAGDDIIELTSGNFNDIDGGGGYDILSLNSGGMIDFSSFTGEEMQRIEEIFLATGQSTTLTLQNVFSLLQSSDYGTLTISGPSASALNFDDMGGGSFASANAYQVADMLGADNAVDTGATWDFSFGGNTLSIDSTLFSSGNVHIL